jgi:hypothetical protein
MKKISLSLIAVIALIGFSCKKSKTDVAIAQSPIVVAHPITKDTLSGSIVGTMTKGKTYFVTDDIVVNPGDTLNIQEGVKVIMLNPVSFVIGGVFKCIGTQDKPILFTGPTGTNAAGAWGGIEGDSSIYQDIEWTNLEYGGAKGDGKVPGATGTQYGLSCKKAGATFIMKDCKISNWGNDGVRLHGCKVTVLRNTFENVGVTGGEAVNVKLGTTGDFGYNVIWSSATNGLKFETSSTVQFPQTNVNVYNNTIVNNGWRNPAKPGNGVLFDLFTRGNVYNNIFVNCKQGLRITKLADTSNVKYGNNLFYTTVDSLKNYFYPIADAGKKQASDLVQVDPLFIALDKNITNTVNTNNVKLQASSPAYGKGNKTYNQDIGAYTSDANSHK